MNSMKYMRDKDRTFVSSSQVAQDRGTCLPTMSYKSFNDRDVRMFFNISKNCYLPLDVTVNS
jgi:hypothetical protein